MPMEFEFEVWEVQREGQADMPAASAIAGSREDALRDARLYAMMYGQDGPVAIYEVTRTLVEEPHP